MTELISFSGAAVLQRIPYFASIDPNQLQIWEALLVERILPRGGVLFVEGEPSAGLYIVGEGRVALYKVSAEGKQQVLMLAGPGQTCNEVAAFDGGPNLATAEALQPSRVYLLPRSALKMAIERQPALALAFVEVFASHIRQLAGLIEDLSFRDVTGRVAKLLLSQDNADTHLTQQQLAAMAGTVREVAARTLKRMEEQGAIEIQRGRITVVNQAILEEMMQ
jgi:CRP/FNR family transcriptional regulator